MVLAGSLAAADAKTYRTLPFEVAAGTTRVEVGYRWDDVVPLPDLPFDLVQTSPHLTTIGNPIFLAEAAPPIPGAPPPGARPPAEPGTGRLPATGTTSRALGAAVLLLGAIVVRVLSVSRISAVTGRSTPRSR